MNKTGKTASWNKNIMWKNIKFQNSWSKWFENVPSSGKESKDGSKNYTEDIKKTLTQINSLLKKGTNLSKNQKDIFVFLSDKGLEKLTDMIKMENLEISKLSLLCLVNI